MAGTHFELETTMIDAFKIIFFWECHLYFFSPDSNLFFFPKNKDRADSGIKLLFLIFHYKQWYRNLVSQFVNGSSVNLWTCMTMSSHNQNVKISFIDKFGITLFGLQSPVE
jgi:hypothetical protein